MWSKSDLNWSNLFVKKTVGVHLYYCVFDQKWWHFFVTFCVIFWHQNEKTMRKTQKTRSSLYENNESWKSYILCGFWPKVKFMEKGQNQFSILGIGYMIYPKITNFPCRGVPKRAVNKVWTNSKDTNDGRRVVVEILTDWSL